MSSTWIIGCTLRMTLASLSSSKWIAEAAAPRAESDVLSLIARCLTALISADEGVDVEVLLRSGLIRRHHLYEQTIQLAVRRRRCARNSTSKCPLHPAAFVSDAPSPGGARHPYSQGAAWSRKRRDDHDLHPRAQQGRPWRDESARRVVILKRRITPTSLLSASMRGATRTCRGEKPAACETAFAAGASPQPRMH